MHLTKRGLSTEFRFLSGPPPKVVVPAKSPATGSISILDELNEFTVELGDKHHSHFPTTEQAADFVSDIIAERVCVTFDYLGDHCIGSSHLRLDHLGITVESLRHSLVGVRGAIFVLNATSGPVRSTSDGNISNSERRLSQHKS